MTDRELLEQAAKAAGMADAVWQDMEGWGEIRHGFSHAMSSDRLWDETGTTYWNPLEDDGDALRLAVKLKVHPETYSGYSVAHYVDPETDEWCSLDERDTDPYAATRRAIVRAAAAMADRA